MKLLLTSSGLSKRSIREAFDTLVGKPASHTKIGFIPTAANVENNNKDWVINAYLQLWRYGYGNIDIIDPSAADVDWRTRLVDCDVVYVGGGNTFHLLNQFRKTGFDVWLRENLQSKVYVGGSAGSMVVMPTIALAGMEPGDENLPGITDLTGLGLVNFELEPHCDHARFANVEAYAKTAKHDVYAIDDLSAIVVDGNEVRVVSEGTWQLYKRV